MTTPREMTKQQVELMLGRVSEPMRSALAGHIAALEAKADMAVNALADVTEALLGERPLGMVPAHTLDAVRALQAERNGLSERCERQERDIQRAETKAERARDAALEEAKRCVAERKDETGYYSRVYADMIDALKAQPARRLVDAKELLAALDRRYAGVRRKHEETVSDDPRKQKFAGMMAAYENVASDFGLTIDEVSP